MFVFPKAAKPPEHDDFWFTDHPLLTANGTPIVPDAAIRYPAVYTCVRIVAEAIMTLPLILYRRTASGGKERAENHWLYPIFHRRPTETQTSAEWRDTVMWHLLLRGNAYAHRGNGMRFDELPLLHPDRVKPERIAGRKAYRYRYTDEDGREHIYLQSEILHLRGPSDDGFMGLNPIEIHSSTTAGTLAQQEFTRRFYENDARPGGWIEHPGYFANDQDRRDFRASWQEAQTGKNWNKTAVLERGMKYHALDMKLSDAQFLESKKYSNHDIARIFRVPPHKLGELDRATHSNIEQQAIEFRQDTVLPWATRIETKLSTELLTPREQGRYFFEFLLDGLERGDSAARSSLYHFAVTDGWMTRNEARSRENLPPLDGLDEPLTPMNMDRTGALDDDDDGDESAESAESASRAILLRNAAEVCVRKEAAVLRKVFADQDRPDVARLRQFYDVDFPSFLQSRLLIDEDQAASYIKGGAKFGPEHLERWEALNMPRLMEIVL